MKNYFTDEELFSMFNVDINPKGRFVPLWTVVKPYELDDDDYLANGCKEEKERRIKKYIKIVENGGRLFQEFEDSSLDKCG